MLGWLVQATSGDVSIDSVDTLTVEGTVDAGGNVALGARKLITTFEGSGINGSSNLYAGGDITLDAVDTLHVDGDVEAGGSMLFRRGGGGTILDNAGDRVGIGTGAPRGRLALIAGGNVVISDHSVLEVTSGSITINADVQAGNGVVIDTNGGVIIDGSLEFGAQLGASVDIDADFGFRIVPGGVSVDAGTTAEINGTLTSVGDIELNSGGSTEVNGSVDSVEGDVLVEAGLVQLWGFDDDVAQDTAGYMNAGLGITIKGGSSIFIDLRGEHKRFDASLLAG
ncbi:MAG: hypothetical protein GY898_00590 [Proteobacteria bacterium]|nr:hypothetical protein [Pseudomonadota bacterium]